MTLDNCCSKFDIKSIIIPVPRGFASNPKARVTQFIMLLERSITATIYASGFDGFTLNQVTFPRISWWLFQTIFTWDDGTN